jgi:hypothetical protein
MKAQDMDKNQSQKVIRVECQAFRLTEFENYYVNKEGTVINLNTHHNCKRLVSQRLDKDGYKRVMLVKNKKPHFVPVHRLVGKAFVKNCKPGLVVNHKDGNKINNIANNLEWITPADNERHARRALGKRCVGEKASRSKLKTHQVIAIREAILEKKEPRLKIVKKYKISASQVQRIVNFKNWSHIA